MIWRIVGWVIFAAFLAGILWLLVTVGYKAFGLWGAILMPLVPPAGVGLIGFAAAAIDGEFDR